MALQRFLHLVDSVSMSMYEVHAISRDSSGHMADCITVSHYKYEKRIENAFVHEFPIICKCDCYR